MTVKRRICHVQICRRKSTKLPRPPDQHENRTACHFLTMTIFKRAKQIIYQLVRMGLSQTGDPENTCAIVIALVARATVGVSTGPSDTTNFRS